MMDRPKDNPVIVTTEQLRKIQTPQLNELTATGDSQRRIGFVFSSSDRQWFRTRFLNAVSYINQ